MLQYKKTKIHKFDVTKISVTVKKYENLMLILFL